MPIIKLHTTIAAPIEVVFDLSRSIELHLASTKNTNERVVDGKKTGLIELSETVTWRAKHLGVYQNLTSIITVCDPYSEFTDEMVKGAFKRFRHEHHFKATNDGTSMIDIFDYTSPLGVLGKLADVLFLKRYMTRFLEERNQCIKQFAESEKWKTLIPLSENYRRV